MARSPRSVRRLLNDKPTLKRLQLELSAQRALLNAVRRCLPDEIQPHCVAAQKRDRLLILHTDSAVWATRLRYLAPKVVSLLHNDYPSLREVKVRLFIAPGQRKPSPHVARRSDAAAQIIHDSARETKQPQLQAALRRLGNALKNS